MSAYVVMIRDRIVDPAEMQAYATLAPLAREGHELEALAFYGRLEVVEGAAADGVVIIRFPSMQEARRWYRSPAYQAALPHRLRGAEYRVLLVEGTDVPVAPDPVGPG
ncbi:DUF1330 domain-containing protein [Frateuria aurantia]